MWALVGVLLGALPTLSSSVGDEPSGAPGIPEGCHWLITGVEEPQAPGGPAVGEFLVLVVEDGRVSGYGGAFFSERFDVRGHVEGLAAHLEHNEPYDPQRWTPATLAWDPAAGAFRGWQRTTADELRRLSAGSIPAPGDPCG